MMAKNIFAIKANRILTILCAVSFMALGLLACAPKATPTGSIEGKAIMMGACGECHRIFLPREYSKAEWRPILERMIPLTSLTPEEKIRLQDYILKNSR
ncbi:hypothetical protein DBT_0439 [Dissulfuribacter thermophilus]|uniref:Cytochrome c n=1 Tax=Dissulfuribacter thermophilus TaxID=1156395 RepID=A0A1B9F7R2_9BACT|nr:hypothetical protein [Dissulfuribacter thermophilus]OCC15977.1 hypothetical protein DBT_0439 [Dissulfuribacter thermophilus]